MKAATVLTQATIPMSADARSLRFVAYWHIDCNWLLRRPCRCSLTLDRSSKHGRMYTSLFRASAASEKNFLTCQFRASKASEENFFMCRAPSERSERENFLRFFPLQSSGREVDPQKVGAGGRAAPRYLALAQELVVTPS